MSVKNFKAGDTFKIAKKIITVTVVEVRDTTQGKKIICKVGGKRVTYTPEKLSSILS